MKLKVYIEKMKKYKWKIFIAILIILSIFRIWLQYNIPLYYISGSIHDDELLLNYAKSIISGNWLGEYNNTTLIKGITFPMFYIFIMLTKMPYAIALSILNIIAVCIFVNSVKNIVKNPYIRGVLYIFLIYSPVTMDSNVSQRLYRNSLTFALSLLVLSGFIGTYLNVDNLKKSIKYSILARC